MEWDELPGCALGWAEEDLQRGGEVRPLLAAHAGHEPLLLAWSRPFPPGGLPDALIELLALVVPLGADRLLLSVGTRVWSLDDPIVPVLPEGDLRQRALLVTTTDASGDEVRQRTVLHPFSVARGRVAWDDPEPVDGGAGWATEALPVALAQRSALRADDQQLRHQALRVLTLGHVLALAPAVADRLDLADGDVVPDPVVRRSCPRGRRARHDG